MPSLVKTLLSRAPMSAFERPARASQRDARLLTGELLADLDRYSRPTATRQG
jgi:hypothetical protein